MMVKHKREGNRLSQRKETEEIKTRTRTEMDELYIAEVFHGPRKVKGNRFYVGTSC